MQLGLTTARAATAGQPEKPGLSDSHEAYPVRRLRERDPLAFRELHDEYRNLVYRTTLRIVGNAAAAEDLTQEVFLSIWLRIGAFDVTRGALPTWISIMARSRAIDYVRSRNCRGAERHAPFEEAARSLPSSAAFSTSRQVEHKCLLQGPWSRLRQHERHTLRLAFYSGMSQSEIARQLKRPLGTVKSWMRQGLQSLRAEFEAAGAA